MAWTELIQNIFYGLGIMGIIFTVYIYFRGPQERSYTNDALLKEKFNELATRVLTLNSDLANLRDNHIHSIDIKIDATNKELGTLAKELVRLNTIIEERIPKKI